MIKNPKKMATATSKYIKVKYNKDKYFTYI